jgi:pentapeptide repeat protein
MSESAALQAARKGPVALEAFQRAHPKDTLDFSGVDFCDPQNEHIQFSDFEFLLEVDFKETKFGNTPVPFQVHGHPSGRGSSKGAALFQKTVFHRNVSFANATFGNEVRFDDSVFEAGACFAKTTFGEAARLSRAVFQTVSFNRSIFGAHAWFDDILVVQDCSFEETIFGNKAQFDRAFFERAHFQSSLFGEDASFESAVFFALAQFNNTEFEAGASFRGVAFCSRAGFEGATFGDFASFRGVERQTLIDIANERAKVLSPNYAQIVKSRARLADPSVFLQATFSGASFTSKGHCYGTKFSQAKDIKARIVEGVREFARRIRVLFYPLSDVMRSGLFAGADFSNRSIKGLADFSRVKFEQPPNFQNVEPATALDLAEARFSFRPTALPRLRYWTTQTETVTRLRRLRKIAKDIEEIDIEQSLFILQRMAERGVAWRVWWDDVLRGWGIYHLINAHLKDRKTEISRLKRRWPLKLVRSIWAAIAGIGRPLKLTFLVFIYRYSSDFGRSIVLPIIWFVLLLFGAAYWYSLYTPAKLRADRIPDLIAFSLSYSFPISPLARQGFETLTTRLFPAGIPPQVLAISTGQTIVETLLLFLMALAIRNHFRVR